MSDLLFVVLQVKLTVGPSKSESTGKGIAWWIILLAVLGAVILLALAIAVLYKVCLK